MTWLFPEVRVRTEIRCRTELSLDGEFLHADECPVSGWPPPDPIETGDCLRGAWVLDTSGDLQRAFTALDITAADATFQAIRDFSVPSCVFVGECSDVQAVQVSERLSLSRRQPVVVFLRQNRLVGDWGLRPVEEAAQGPVACDMSTRLLAGLSRRDVMALVSRSTPFEIKRTPARVTRSILTGSAEDEGALHTYLALVNDARRLTVYCRLPVMDPCDPRQVVLLHNLTCCAAAEAAVADHYHKSFEERKTP